MKTKSFLSVKVLSSLALGLFFVSTNARAQSTSTELSSEALRTIFQSCDSLHNENQARIDQIQADLRNHQPGVLREIHESQDPLLAQARSFWLPQQRLLVQIARQTLPGLTDSNFQATVARQRSAIQELSQRIRDAQGPSDALYQLQGSIRDQLRRSIEEFIRLHEQSAMTVVSNVFRQNHYPYSSSYQFSLREEGRFGFQRYPRTNVYRPSSVDFDVAEPRVQICSELSYSSRTLCSKANSTNLVEAESALASYSVPNENYFREALSLELPQFGSNGDFVDYLIAEDYCHDHPSYEYGTRMSESRRAGFEYCQLRSRLYQARSSLRANDVSCTQLGWHLNSGPSSSTNPVTTHEQQQPAGVSESGVAGPNAQSGASETAGADHQISNGGEAGAQVVDTNSNK